MEANAQIMNRIYAGVDLSVKHAAEISGYASVWAWIQARIREANYNGILIGDYIPFSLTDGKTFKADIAGIDTYYKYSDIPVPHHIDLITRECHPDRHVFNKARYNNGSPVSQSPWLASDLYAWLNSLKMDVPNSATANPVMVNVDYTSSGVYNKLPSALQNVIVPKRVFIPTRYTAGSLLIDDNYRVWESAGKLWIPFETEVYGHESWGSKNGYSDSGFVQYPIFAQCMKRRKDEVWWLASTVGGALDRIAVTGGLTGHLFTTDPGVSVPLCFRIA